MKEVDLAEMLEAGVHFGHQPSRWHPKMKTNIFSVRNGVHIIDLEQTQKALQKALDFLYTQTKQGKTVLLVGTKRQAKSVVQEFAKQAGMPYLVERWVGGLLTNYSEVSKLIDRLRDLKAKRASGELEKYTKKERLQFDREIEKLQTLIGGMEDMEKLPDAVVLMSSRDDKTALREAKRSGIPVISLVDTNSNPELVDFPIPANDDAIKSLRYMAQKFAEAVTEGRAAQVKNVGSASAKPGTPEQDKPKQETVTTKE